MKWKTLQHNGICFPPPYESRRIKIRISGEEVDLDISQEEMIYHWAKKKDTPYVQDSVFQRNFTMDFAKILKPGFRKIAYKDIDFSDAYRIVDREKEEREEKKKEEREARIEMRDKEREALARKKKEEREARIEMRDEEKKAMAKMRDEEKKAMAKMRDEEKKAMAKMTKDEKVAFARKKKEEREAFARKKKEEREAFARKKKEEREAFARKKNAERDRLKRRYGTAVMNRRKVDVANYMAEPPGIFIGRGDHPLRGRWKPRIDFKDVTLNLGTKKGNVPKGDWGNVVSERDVTWLAKWTDKLTGNTKYVWLADTARIKQDKDKEKYDKAAKLEAAIGKILKKMIRDMKRKDEKIRTVATVCYLIYRTAMRVGDEKDPDEADTVGATTLRKEHITITDDAVEFDFLGKDSVRWQETVKAEGDDRQFQKNLKRMIGKKKPKDEIFDKITSRQVNAYYSRTVKGMTAKVFRTYLATKAVKEYLAKQNTRKMGADVRIHHAKLANLEAAKKCNHKRTIPKTFEESLQKKKDRLKDKKKEKPWKKTEAELTGTKSGESGAGNQKQDERTAKLKRHLKEQKRRHRVQIKKIEMQIELTEKTKDYNLDTSLRNYIDPRTFDEWVGAEWEKMYTSALQKKFLWVRDKKSK